MASILTRHIQNFGTDDIPSGKVLDELKRLLRRRMRRRGLTSLPPALLGYDAPDWDDRNALDDLVADGYVHAIALRIESLQRALRPDDDIDALIVHNLDHFLSERQRDHNPIGYSVYQNVRLAVRLATEAGWLNLDRQKGQPLTRAVLCFQGQNTMPPLTSPALAEELAQQPGLAEIARSLSSRSHAAQEWIFGVLDRLRQKRPEPIVFGDLVRLLEEYARDAWPSRAPAADEVAADLSDEGAVELVKIVRADTSADDQDLWDELVRRITEGIGRLRQQEKVRKRRLLVFAEIARHAEESKGQAIRQVDIAQSLDINQVTLHNDIEAIRMVISQVLSEKN